MPTRLEPKKCQALLEAHDALTIPPSSPNPLSFIHPLLHLLAVVLFFVLFFAVVVVVVVVVVAVAVVAVAVLLLLVQCSCEIQRTPQLRSCDVPNL
jgi:hypothetical protein